MSAGLRINTEVSVDGKNAEAGLLAVAGKVADTKIALIDANAATKAASDALKTLKGSADATAEAEAQLTQKLRDATQAKVLAANAARQAETELRRMGQAANDLGHSSGTARLGMFELEHVFRATSDSITAGQDPLRAFILELPRVAEAATFAGGALGGVGKLLAGPWGLAVTAAVSLLGPLAIGLLESGKGAETATTGLIKQKTAAETLTAALTDLDRASGRLNRTTEESIRIGTAAAEASLKKALAKRTELAAEIAADLQNQKQLLQQGPGASVIGGNGAAIGAFAAGNAASSLQAQAAENKLLIDQLGQQIKGGQFATALADAKVKTDEAAAAARVYEREIERLKQGLLSGALTQTQATAGAVAAMQTQKAALDAIKERQKDARDAARDHNKELREEEKAAEAAAKALEKLVIAARNVKLPQIDSGAIASQLGKANDTAILRSDDPFKNQPDDLLTKLVGISDAQELQSIATRFGGDTAKALKDQTIGYANEIGRALGGNFGKAISAGSEIGGLLSKLSPAAGDAYNKGFISSLETISEPVVKTLGNIFGSDGTKFASLLGNVGAYGAVAAGVLDLGTSLGLIGKGQYEQNKALFTILGGLGGALAFSILSPARGGTATISNAYDVATNSGNGASQIAIANSLAGSVQSGLENLAAQLGGTVGSFAPISIGKRNDNFRVDTTGASIGKYNGKDFGTGDAAAQAAVQYAIEVAIQRGAISGLSARVQSAITRFGDDLNRAVSEAVKVKNIEDLLANHENPFTTAFKTLEAGLADRLNIAKSYGFDLVEIEKINGEDRAKALSDALSKATGSIQSLLKDFQFGTGATGSIAEQLAAATTERDRLVGLVKGGDTSQLDNVASIVKQIDTLQSQAYGSTAAFASGRADSTALLNDLVQQTQDRINAAAAAAQAQTASQTDSLTAIAATSEDQYGVQKTMASSLASIDAQLAALTSGGSAEALANLYVRNS